MLARHRAPRSPCACLRPFGWLTASSVVLTPQATNDLESTPGLDSDIGDTPSTGASSRLAPSLPITPGTPLLRYVPRGAKQQGRLVPATSTPSKSHSRHHTSPLHRTGLSSTTFAPPVEVREAADDDDENDLEHTGPTVSNVEYGFRRLRLQSARSESTPESPTAESVIDRAEFDAKGASSSQTMASTLANIMPFLH